MKKIVSLILCFTMICSFGALTASASAEKKSLIVFVPGIGQTYTYSFDEEFLEDGAFESGTLHDYKNYTALIENGQYAQRWNLIYNLENELLNPTFVVKLLLTVQNLIAGSILHKNLVRENTVKSAIAEWLKYNTIDENGKLPENVITPRRVCPLSEYPTHTDENGEIKSEAKSRFYSSIPCAEAAEEKLGANYEDYLYCYNYSCFSYTSDNVEGLHSFIETIIKDNRVGADDVVLVPMSMGASVVSAYLAKYPAQKDNHVKRVVSIVGCWDGSELVTDLLNLDYADNSAEMFYKSFLPSYIDNAAEMPIGVPLLLVLRLLPKAQLRNLIDIVLSSIDDFILSTPSLTALVPSEDYMSFRERIPEGRVRQETDEYYNCQLTLKERFAELEKQGIGLSFIAAYGSPFGGITPEYNIFSFMKSAETTNSDEIINISSTAPGTGYVSYNKTFPDGNGRILSPDKTIDISTTYYRDSTWFFYKEMHDLKYDNTALRLAVALSTGEISSVGDCDNPQGTYYYPQFNGARNARQLSNDIKAVKKYLEKERLSPEQQKIYEKALAVKNSTVNNPVEDSAAADALHNMLTDSGIITAEKEKDFRVLNRIFSFINCAAYAVFGAKGYFDR